MEIDELETMKPTRSNRTCQTEHTLVFIDEKIFSSLMHPLDQMNTNEQLKLNSSTFDPAPKCRLDFVRSIRLVIFFVWFDFWFNDTIWYDNDRWYY